MSDDNSLLVLEHIKKGLSRLGRTADGSGYAFVDLELEGKDLKDLYDFLKQYPHLRYINISKNQIKNIESIYQLQYLLVLNAAKNHIQTLCKQIIKEGLDDRQRLTNLEHLNLSNNKIQQLDQIYLPSLKSLNLNDNQITSCVQFKGHFSLEILQMRRNKLQSLEGLKNLNSLKELYLPENEIQSMVELKFMPELRRLHIRNNQIDNLDLNPQLNKLEYLNVRQNKIVNFVEFEKIKVQLFNLEFAFNYYFECKRESLYRRGRRRFQEINFDDFILATLEVIFIKRLQKDEISQEEKEEIINDIKEKERQEEEKRKEEEQRRFEAEQERLKKEAEELEQQRLEEEIKQKAEQEALEEQMRLQQEQDKKNSDTLNQSKEDEDED